MLPLFIHLMIPRYGKLAQEEEEEAHHLISAAATVASPSPSPFPSLASFIDHVVTQLLS